MEHDIPVVILCGGQGTRIREASERLPKAMVEIGGRPMLWHIMKIYSHYGTAVSSCAWVQGLGDQAVLPRTTGLVPVGLHHLALRRAHPESDELNFHNVLPTRTGRSPSPRRAGGGDRRTGPAHPELHRHPVLHADLRRRRRQSVDLNVLEISTERRHGSVRSRCAPDVEVRRDAGRGATRWWSSTRSPPGPPDSCPEGSSLPAVVPRRLPERRPGASGWRPSHCRSSLGTAR